MRPLVQVEIDGLEVAVEVVGQEPRGRPDVVRVSRFAVLQRFAAEDHLAEDRADESVVVVLVFGAVEPALDEGAGPPAATGGKFGCLGATEHKTGLSKALDPNVPNYIPF
jgi:hypothetical protein